MKSKRGSELDGFHLEVPVTSEDLAALERVEKWNYLPPQQYLEFLLAVTAGKPGSREIPERHEPFVL